jgi:hypothetical protein
MSDRYGSTNFRGDNLSTMTRSQSRDRELQRHEQPSAFCKQTIFINIETTL